MTTDNIRTIARNNNTTPATIRRIAIDLDLPVRYSKDRRCWHLDTDRVTIAVFNDHVAEVI